MRLRLGRVLDHSSWSSASSDTEVETSQLSGPCRASLSGDTEVGPARTGIGRTTMSSVAIGPRSRDSSHHTSPLRPLPWANPAFISVSVPQPTAPLLAFKCSPCSGDRYWRLRRSMRRWPPRVALSRISQALSQSTAYEQRPLLPPSGKRGIARFCSPSTSWGLVHVHAEKR
jgi:hypothetical protein